jgi:hypothetical protein
MQGLGPARFVDLPRYPCMKGAPFAGDLRAAMNVGQLLEKSVAKQQGLEPRKNGKRMLNAEHLKNGIHEPALTPNFVFGVPNVNVSSSPNQVLKA